MQFPFIFYLARGFLFFHFSLHTFQRPLCAKFIEEKVEEHYELKHRTEKVDKMFKVYVNLFFPTNSLIFL